MQPEWDYQDRQIKHARIVNATPLDSQHLAFGGDSMPPKWALQIVRNVLGRHNRFHNPPSKPIRRPTHLVAMSIPFCCAFKRKRWLKLELAVDASDQRSLRTFLRFN